MSQNGDFPDFILNPWLMISVVLLIFTTLQLSIVISIHCALTILDHTLKYDATEALPSDDVNEHP